MLLCTLYCRFTDISGKLDERIFAKNYSFLDEYREKEIDVLSKTLKKIKSAPKKEELKTELLKYVLYNLISTDDIACYL